MFWSIIYTIKNYYKGEGAYFFSEQNLHATTNMELVMFYSNFNARKVLICEISEIYTIFEIFYYTGPLILNYMYVRHMKKKDSEKS